MRGEPGQEDGRIVTKDTDFWEMGIDKRHVRSRIGHADSVFFNLAFFPRWGGDERRYFSKGLRSPFGSR